MVARKIFHVLVGFFCGSLAFSFTYFAGSFIDSLIRGASGDAATSLFRDLPRLAMITSIALPLALAVVVWRSRRYIALGLLAFSLLSLTWWLPWNSPASR
jgi:hypothetical protein